MDAAGVTTHYVIDTSTSLSADGNNPLTADAGGAVTTYLYGLGVVAEKTTTWNYALPDGSNTPRQLIDASGEVTLAARYTPCPLRGCFARVTPSKPMVMETLPSVISVA